MKDIIKEDQEFKRQKLANNLFFLRGERVLGEISPISKQLPAYISRKLLWMKWFLLKRKILTDPK
jgi:hypothetical protein